MESSLAAKLARSMISFNVMGSVELKAATTFLKYKTIGSQYSYSLGMQ